MNEGQMTVQMPLGALLTVTMPASPAKVSVPVEDRIAKGFSGLLNSMSPAPTSTLACADGTSKAAVTKPSGTMETAMLMAHADILPAAVADFFHSATEDGLVTSTAPAGDKNQTERSDREKDQKPQDVVISAAGVQMITAQQINGRMPELLATHASGEDMPAVRVAGTTDVGESLKEHSAMKSERVKAPPREATVVQASPLVEVMGDSFEVPTPAVQQNAATQITQEQPTGLPQPQPVISQPVAAQTVVSQPVASQPVVSQPAASQPVASQPVASQPVASQPVASQPVVSQPVASQPVASQTVVSQPVAAQPAIAQPLDGITATRNAADQEPFRTALKKVVMPAGKAVASVPEQVETAGLLNTSADSDSRQIESVKARSMVRPVLDAYFQTSSVPSSKNVRADVPPVGQTEALARLDAANADAQAILTARVPTGMPHTVFPSVQEETPTAPKNRAEGVEGMTTQNENVVATALDETMSTDSGESFGEEGRGSFDRHAGVQNHVIQLKTEHSQPTSGATESSETVRSGLLKQVVGQVREHLLTRENKSGVEQVVIRLSPESLGELKLNLRMENQCLKVEIVAENSMVRDTLIKYSDTLKESLASQNITMETFDVSTGNNRNGAGSYGQNQAGWQELAHQRQQAAWRSSGGYRLSDTPEVPKNPMYLASTEHSMLDVHF